MVWFFGITSEGNRVWEYVGGEEDFWILWGIFVRYELVI